MPRSVASQSVSAGLGGLSHMFKLGLASSQLLGSVLIFEASMFGSACSAYLYWLGWVIGIDRTIG